MPWDICHFVPTNKTFTYERISSKFGCRLISSFRPYFVSIYPMPLYNYFISQKRQLLFGERTIKNALNTTTVFYFTKIDVSKARVITSCLLDS